MVRLFQNLKVWTFPSIGIENGAMVHRVPYFRYLEAKPN